MEDDFILIGSSSFMQVSRTCINVCMSLIVGQIPPLTTKLAALERLKNKCTCIMSSPL